MWFNTKWPNKININALGIVSTIAFIMCRAECKTVPVIFRGGGL